MTKSELSTYISEITDLSFRRLNEIYNANKEHRTSSASRLIFPRLRNGQLRICEQEMRFVFIEVFTQYCALKNLELFYSIETPSRDKYDFSGETPRSGAGQSAMFDLVIFDKYDNPRVLIEFKANNADAKSHQKDLVKLTNREEGNEDVLRYFIEIIDNYDDSTLDSLKSKLSSGDSDIKVEKIIYSLRKKQVIHI